MDLLFHDLWVYTKPLKPYVKNWVCEFYIAYWEVLSIKRRKRPQGTRIFFRVKGVDVIFDEKTVKEVLGC